MPKTAKRLSGPATLTGSAATVYTVPAATKTIIRHIHFANTDSAARTVTVSIGTNAVGTQVIAAKSIAATDTYDWYGYIVMDAAEILQALASVTSVVNMSTYGDEITLG